MKRGHRTILVVAAHPDDEVLGCGATLAKYARQGHAVHVLLLTEGVTARFATRDAPDRVKDLRRLARSARTASKILGVKTLTRKNFPDNRMDGVNLLDVVKAVEERILALNPDTVLTHHGGDLNIDHRVTFEAVLTACRPIPRHGVTTLLFFETPSATEWRPTATPFVPSWFEDVDATLALKLKALRCYRGELRPWPHPRSLKAVEHLARWRGASSGFPAAEAFMTGRVRR